MIHYIVSGTCRKDFYEKKLSVLLTECDLLYRLWFWVGLFILWFVCVFLWFFLLFLLLFGFLVCVCVCVCARVWVCTSSCCSFLFENFLFLFLFLTTLHISPLPTSLHITLHTQFYIHSFPCRNYVYKVYINRKHMLDHGGNWCQGWLNEPLMSTLVCSSLALWAPPHQTETQEI